MHARDGPNLVIQQYDIDVGGRIILAGLSRDAAWSVGRPGVARSNVRSDAGQMLAIGLSPLEIELRIAKPAELDSNELLA